MYKLLSILLLGAGVLCAQPGVCYVGQTASHCSTAGPAPTLQSYVSNLNTQIGIANGVSVSLPQPAIQLAVDLAPAQSNFRAQDTPGCNTPINTCIYSTALPNNVSIGLDQYINKFLVPTGAKYLYYNNDILFFTQANTYTGSCVPNNPSWTAHQLAVDISVLQYAQTKGFTIRLSASPLTTTFTACGLVVGNSTSMSVANVEAAINPILTAEVEYLVANGIQPDLILPWHEFQGYTQNITGITYTPTQATALLSSACTAIHTISGQSTLKCGGGFTAGDSTYVSNYTSNPGGSNIFAGETYSPPASLAAVLADLATFCAEATTAGLPCYNSEGNPPVWGTTGSESGAYAGCAWTGWPNYNLYPAWGGAVRRYLSATGYKDFVLFGSQAFSGLDVNQTQNCYYITPSLNATAYILNPANAAGPSGNLAGWVAATGSYRTGTQGGVQITGGQVKLQ